MTAKARHDDLEARIGEWRGYLRRHRAIHSVDVEELEDRLRDQVARLVETGLSGDEAFLVAVKRMGDLDAPARELARGYSERLWKQLAGAPGSAHEPGGEAGREALVALGLALAAAAAIKLPELFGIRFASEASFYARNFSLFTLPLLAGYFAWKRQLGGTSRAWLALPFVAGAVLANVFPFTPQGHTEVLTALHLPIALWLAVGLAYAGGRWRDHGRRMDFVRFSGEWFIYYALIAFGGGVLMAFTAFVFGAIGADAGWLLESWLLPCGAVGAVIVSAWLVEAKQSVVENMAPVLTRLFTPLFLFVLVAFLGTMAWTGSGIDVDREVLIGFDLLLALVLGLLLYAISARDPSAPPGAFDALQLSLVGSALVVDALALAAIAGRIADFGFSPNKVAALGENLILLANLAGSAVLYSRFLTGRGSFTTLERWQTAFLPVYAAWAWLVVAVFPPLFGYL
ncbi:MAG: permease prefix domain 1-containing protein [Acidobacteriota bacterium]|nr:permease prefix domain 1-containing protein [Acidobacteriota bacterium]MDH3523364.1 permease prefix domain 1-containing protein [Acidobacteriota bacterium]